MTLTRWQRPSGWGLAPWRRTNQVQNELDQLLQVFNQVFESPLDLGRATSALLPAVDLFEGKDTFTVKAELPGMKKDDINISLHDGLLTLSGERKESKEYQEGEVSRAERYVGHFHRTVSLPSKVNADSINATYTDGVLTVVLPKAEEAKPKQIKVNFN